MTAKMSKQAAAKEAQGYTTDKRNCSNCAHRQCDRRLPAWMQRENARHPEHPTWGDHHAQEVNQRCGIGGFAVKATAWCNQWATKA
jgi:hypothetical protein